MNMSNLISALNNSIKANKTSILYPASNQILQFLEVLNQHRFINGYTRLSHKQVKIYFGYSLQGSPVLKLKAISKPSTPVYLKCKDLWKFDKNLSILILTTSKGIISHKQALIQGIGGQVLAYIL